MSRGLTRNKAIDISFDGVVVYHRVEYSNAVEECEIRAGKKEGRGVITYANGDIYDGEWKANKREGHGVWTCADSSTYRGEWQEGKLKTRT